MRAILLAAALITPDCQRLCSYGARCWYDWFHMHCADPNVVCLGPANIIPTSYVPWKEYEFTPLWAIPYPSPWGTYEMEHR